MITFNQSDMTYYDYDISSFSSFSDSMSRYIPSICFKTTRKYLARLLDNQCNLISNNIVIEEGEDPYARS